MRVSHAFFPDKAPYTVMQCEDKFHLRPVRFLELQKHLRRNGFLQLAAHVVYA